MPVKRRNAKARRDFDEEHMQDMFYGPGTCMFNGHGYLGPHDDGFWHEKPEHVQQAVIAEMREDWERNAPAVMAAWLSRTEHDLYIAREFHNNPDQPWAAEQFGMESDR
jgi:hypothetical protein